MSLLWGSQMGTLLTYISNWVTVPIEKKNFSVMKGLVHVRIDVKYRKKLSNGFRHRSVSLSRMPILPFLLKLHVFFASNVISLVPLKLSFPNFTFTILHYLATLCKNFRLFEAFSPVKMDFKVGWGYSQNVNFCIKPISIQC